MVLRKVLLFTLASVIFWWGFGLAESDREKSAEISRNNVYHYQFKRFIKEDRSWLEMELKEESGKPVSYTGYVVKLGDGTIKRGTLDSNGKAVVNVVASGSCFVSFPQLDMEEVEMK